MPAWYKNYKTMNVNQFVCNDVSGYETPDIKVLDLENEGLLCSSTTDDVPAGGQTEGYLDGEFNWN